MSPVGGKQTQGLEIGGKGLECISDLCPNILATINPLANYSVSLVFSLIYKRKEKEKKKDILDLLG